MLKDTSLLQDNNGKLCAAFNVFIFIGFEHSFLGDLYLQMKHFIILQTTMISQWNKSYIV